ncbi:PREDICTED: transposon [Prunus dulcis]|uniref:PREDICTED: transposon n=1 Tax=Prunus dulcis TaxID=3755 RepID=A0A5E4GP13_PRUDU|nr:PREDICTED: transposon [Prunus dulcis]
MYICLGACKEGFKAGCRPVIGLDGCHLKSPYEGQLLSAVGLDANNMTWVIAYAQKGLVEAFEEAVPNCDHRFCARHLSILKDAMWRAAFATTVPKFRRAMKVLRTLDGEVDTANA